MIYLSVPGNGGDNPSSPHPSPSVVILHEIFISLRPISSFLSDLVPCSAIFPISSFFLSVFYLSLRDLPALLGHWTPYALMLSLYTCFFYRYLRRPAEEG